jgi:uncharacterized alkaline shock family protein YloU
MTSQPSSASPAGSTPLPPKSNTTKTPAGQGKGSTTIAESVVAKIAGIAARQVPGVYALGSGVARAVGQIRDVVSQHDMSQGVSVEVGHTQAAVDVILVVDYPYPLQDVAGQVRDAIYDAVETLVGLEVTEVNISIADIRIPSDDQSESPRVS